MHPLLLDKIEVVMAKTLSNKKIISILEPNL
jgi:hypothetical protein